MEATALGFAGGDLNDTDDLHCFAFHDHLTKRRHIFIKILAILFWLGPDNIDCCLQLNALYSLDKVAIVYST